MGDNKLQNSGSQTAEGPAPLVTIEGLRTHFFTDEGTVAAVDGIDIVIPRGKTVALVGESGSGKSVTALSTMRLVDKPGRIIAGRITLYDEQGNVDVVLTDVERTGKVIRRVRGKRIAMIFQEPMTSLSPVHTVGSQIVEAIRLHTDMDRKRAKAHAIGMMERMGIPNAAECFMAYPHQMSGGLRQRVMIAMAISCRPALLIADEPTTALDVTIQAQILELLADLKREFKMSVLFITHELGVVAQIADEVAVMYQGRIVERGEVHQIYASPKHEYTKALIKAVPSVKAERRVRLSTVAEFAAGERPPQAAARKVALDRPPLLGVRNLKKYFPVTMGFLKRTRATLKAVDDVSFDIYEGECLGLVGESGSGKTTVGHCMLRAQTPTAGSVKLRVGEEFCDLTAASGEPLKLLRRKMGIIFQDPFSSLDPRMTVQDVVGEPLRLGGVKSRTERLDRVRELIVRVGLEPEHLVRFPHAFSGGQRQRIGIARALVLRPSFVMADEPVSSLDVSVQAQVLALLQELQAEMGLSYLFVSHDLSVVRHIADRVAVMYCGKLMELAETDELFANPLHPYTRALLSAVPVPDPNEPMKRIDLGVEPPDPTNPPCACALFGDCPADRGEDLPAAVLREVKSGHFVRCHDVSDVGQN
ncbi:MAG: ABC transporter ATP-binding protein [Planctomycetota bacterium]|jgi:peptide/nickel transport system ATP-binding protein